MRDRWLVAVCVLGALCSLLLILAPLFGVWR